MLKARRGYPSVVLAFAFDGLLRRHDGQSACATTWRTSVFPDSKAKAYLLPVKKAIRTAEDLGAEDRVRVILRLVDAGPSPP